jgi:hypothetical protein
MRYLVEQVVGEAQVMAILLVEMEEDASLYLPKILLRPLQLLWQEQIQVETGVRVVQEVGQEVRYWSFVKLRP